MPRSLSKIILVLTLFMLASCKKDDTNVPEELPTVKTHTWYAFTDSGFEAVDLPQKSPSVVVRPWTEAVRISSAACAPSASAPPRFLAYALVNKRGLLCFSPEGIEFYTDSSIFENESADSLLFVDGKPLFSLYQSTFFSPNINSEETIFRSRPFLVYFDPQSSIFFPMVSYANLNLKESDQITSVLWDGERWVCSAKSVTPPQEDGAEGRIDFSYFYWNSVVPLSDLSPAIQSTAFSFEHISEIQYQELNMPHMFQESPQDLKDIASSLPQEISFYVTYHDLSGLSAKSYFKGSGEGTVLNARASLSCPAKYCVIVFEDGTTYVQKTGDSASKVGFRLPLLPKGYTYGEEVIAGDTLYVAWEETLFFETKRAGFIAVNLKDIIP